MLPRSKLRTRSAIGDSRSVIWAGVVPVRGSFRGDRKVREPADKPGSVEDNHSSGSVVADALKRPTREPVRLRRCARRHALPYLALLRAGFTLPPSVATGAVRSYRTFSPLPAPCEALGGVFSVALSVGSRPPGVTWRSGRWSPDFPPSTTSALRDYLADSLGADITPLPGFMFADLKRCRIHFVAVSAGSRRSHLDGCLQRQLGK